MCVRIGNLYISPQLTHLRRPQARKQTGQDRVSLLLYVVEYCGVGVGESERIFLSSSIAEFPLGGSNAKQGRLVGTRRGSSLSPGAGNRIN